MFALKGVTQVFSFSVYLINERKKKATYSFSENHKGALLGMKDIYSMNNTVQNIRIIRNRIIETTISTQKEKLCGLHEQIGL